MKKNVMSFKTKGMNKDLSVSAFNPEFSFENKNLRLLTNDGNTLLSWVNEKGTEEIPLVNDLGFYVNIQGTPIGTAILDKNLILFTTNNVLEEHPDTNIDYIYKFNFSENKDYLLCTTLFQGNLNFHASYPIETIVSYETDTLQKVYWTDNRNQLRFINICNLYISNPDGSLYTKFDFIPTLQLNETVKVHKEFNVNGTFASGVIQYALTYYNMNGLESNIFYVSPLLYVSPRDRGARPDEKVEVGFKITVEHIDLNFEYLRVYSIQRTSINSTPMCKRIRDIDLKGLEPNTSISWIDTGDTGDSIDPTELLYKGGDIVIAKTIELKDGTLFMGGIKLKRTNITLVKENITMNPILCSYRRIYASLISTGAYNYANQLSADAESQIGKMTVPCGGFKTGNVYRLGVQFQHKSGKWSEPLFINDVELTGGFNINPEGNEIVLPNFYSSLPFTGRETLEKAGYKKMRPLVVLPQGKDRNVLCQGVAAPVVYTPEDRNNRGVHSQSSWFFRAAALDHIEGTSTTVVMPRSFGDLRYTYRGLDFNPSYMRLIEIEGEYNNEKKFHIDRNYRTLHSPDIEFDDLLQSTDFSNKYFLLIGKQQFVSTMSDIDILTETPTIGNRGGGFVHKSFVSDGGRGIVAGLFYDDSIVDDDVLGSGKISAYPYPHLTAKWLIYPWQGTGSLNNDINRPADLGAASAKLKKKTISNLRFAYMEGMDRGNKIGFLFSPLIFSSDESAILKFSVNGTTGIYRGNIDTVLMPDDYDGKYFAFEGIKPSIVLMGVNSGMSWKWTDDKTEFNSTHWWKTWNDDANNAKDNSLREWDGTSWEYNSGVGDDIGETYVDLVVKKLQVRMKYKSSPHIFAYFGKNNLIEDLYELAVVDILLDVTNRYGGTSTDALRENTWIPCGEPVRLNETLYWNYGDTYYQRYDCLKTYPYTNEDLNLIIEIGSFQLETYVNIDGRYDRNRGLVSNLNVSPRNFNLMNPVYSQQDNFFSYKILSEDYYTNTIYPNLITWSKTKENGADVDLWTNVTLASILELDGDKGTINKLVRFNNQLICFQDTGISLILYNENALISTTEGVPIELANSGKVLGKRYLNNAIGCSNKWSICLTPMGIYFIDSNDKSIYLYNGEFANVSQTHGFNSWCKMNIKTSSKKWDSYDFDDFTTVYDKVNQDVLFINKDIALAFSEKLLAFTSFYDYEKTPYLCNLEDAGIWIRKDSSLKLWRHQGGRYCTFFNIEKPYWITLVGNPEPLTDKTFTNLEFRACVANDIDSGGPFDDTFNDPFLTDGDLSFYLPFDYLETWNEYQHGYTSLENKNGHDAMIHGTDSSSLKRRFRIWRCDIPRNNTILDKDRSIEEEYPYSKDSELNISRVIRKPHDRMRNPWLYLKLQKTNNVFRKCEIHDFVMTYFN